MIDTKKIKIGDVIEYKSNDGLVKIRNIGRISSYPSFVVADSKDDYHYHVYGNEIINHYTKKENPEYYL